MLILSEPTRGIDVGSKVEIYRLIDSMAHEGMGVLVMSTELPEIIGIATASWSCTRAASRASLPGPRRAEERIIAAATGMTGNGQPKEAVAA